MWARERLAAIDELERALRPYSSGSPRERIFGAVTIARLYDTFADLSEAVPAPPSIRQDAQALQAYESALRSAMLPLRERAVAAYEYCAGVIGAPPALERTIALCGERVASLRTSIEHVRATISARRRPSGMVLGVARDPTMCGLSVRELTANRRTPPEGTPLEIAVTYSGSEIPAAARERVMRAVHHRLAQEGNLRLVPRAEVRRAERLVAQRRTDERGPVCARGPTLAEALATNHPNLAFASIHATCGRIDATHPSGCSLEVHFVQAAGTPTQLPEDLEAWTPEGARGVAAWLVAARVLSNARMVGVFGVLGTDAQTQVEGLIPAPTRQVWMNGLEDDESSLRVPNAIAERERALLRCFEGAGTARFDIAIDLDPQGAIDVVRVSAEAATLRGEPEDIEHVRVCVEHALESASFGCPASGPVTVEATMCIGD